jgi:hypothetical protein
MAFKKGDKRPVKAGRTKGTPNKLTRTVKECVLEAFNKLQEHPTSNILAWAEKNPKDFYQVAAKLIPTELNGQVDTVIKVIRE